MFKENYRENRQTLRRLRHTLKTFTKGKDTLYVNGFSGACESDSRNRRTVFCRCNNLKGYLIKFYGLREKDFKTTNRPYLHPEAGDVVIISLYPAGMAEEVQADTLPPMHPPQEGAAPGGKKNLVPPEQRQCPKIQRQSPKWKRYYPKKERQPRKQAPPPPPAGISASSWVCPLA